MICPRCLGTGMILRLTGDVDDCPKCGMSGVICDTCRKAPDHCECADGEDGEIEEPMEFMGIEDGDD
jgi:hypothetical protein